MSGAAAAVLLSSWLASAASGAQPTVWIRIPDPASTLPELKESLRWTALLDPSLGPAPLERRLSASLGIKDLSGAALHNRGLDQDAPILVFSRPRELNPSHRRRSTADASKKRAGYVVAAAQAQVADRKKWLAWFADSGEKGREPPHPRPNIKVFTPPDSGTTQVCLTETPDDAPRPIDFGRSNVSLIPNVEPRREKREQDARGARIEVQANDFDPLTRVSALIELSRARIVAQARARFALAASLLAGDFAATRPASPLIALGEKDVSSSPVVNFVGRLDRPYAAMQWLHEGQKNAMAKRLSGEFQLLVSARGGLVFAARLSESAQPGSSVGLEKMSRDLLEAWFGPQLARGFRVHHVETDPPVTASASARPSRRLVVLTLPESNGSTPVFEILPPPQPPATVPPLPPLPPLSIDVAVDQLIAAAMARHEAKEGPTLRPSALLGLRIGFGRFLARTSHVRLRAALRGSSMQMDGEIAYRM
ncbi:MAG: hypothetical protein IPK13_03475 [Deltaproteobacteria bacterium]|nr:hypothetical protein [Deltaproteobacteria bacterium]